MDLAFSPTLIPCHATIDDTASSSSPSFPACQLIDDHPSLPVEAVPRIIKL